MNSESQCINVKNMLSFHVCFISKDIVAVSFDLWLYTVKPVNKGHPREKQHMAFKDKWPLFGGYNVLFNEGRVTEIWSLFTGRSLVGGDL